MRNNYPERGKTRNRKANVTLMLFKYSEQMDVLIHNVPSSSLIDGRR